MPDTGPLEPIAARILDHFAEKNSAREEALSASRRIVRDSANCIRAVHRGELDAARELLARAEAAHREIAERLVPHQDLYFTGFVLDAQKEFAEAATTLALIDGAAIPDPDDLAVEPAAYLNGIAEAIGELRRWILDRLRRGVFDGCEDALHAMDDIYGVLVTIDYPDAMTLGLRRTTDQARGILERTRGDLTIAIVQHEAARAFDTGRGGET